MNAILCPSDFSNFANNALDYAIHFAKKADATLFLLNVYRNTYPASDPLFENLGNLEEDSQAKLETVREKLQEKYKDKLPKIELVSREGFAVEEILRESEGKDLIIMGTKGATGLEKILLGSNTTRVIEDATIPVMAIPDEAKFTDLSQMVFATDWLTEDNGVIKQLVRFAKYFDSTIKILHVLETDEEFSDEQLLKVKEVYPEILSYSKISIHIEHAESIWEGISNFLEKYESNLVATVTRKRSFFDKIFMPSLTKKISYQSETPLIAFHE